VSIYFLFYFSYVVGYIIIDLTPSLNTGYFYDNYLRYFANIPFKCQIYILLDVPLIMFVLIVAMFSYYENIIELRNLSM